MSFPIVFMYNNEPMNKISKTPVEVYTLEGVLKDETSIVDPVILISKSGTMGDVNYAYIAQFNRYYYIRDAVSNRNGLWEVTMHTDVLKTFSEGILGSPAIIAKSSKKYNLYLNDADYKCQQNDIIMTQNFPNGFTPGDAGSRFCVCILGDRVRAT